jgi:aryl-alcohol dehydrogenase-like predicted oxidoreductase
MADLMTVPRVASIQNSYSLLDRQFEIGLAEVAIREGVGLIGYSPLASGTLTGKYGEKPAPIPGSRSDGSPSFVSRLLSPARHQAIAAYADLARAHGLEPAHMALAFAAQQPFMASVLMAASTADQLASNLGAIDVTLPKDVTQAINAIHDAHPNPK